MMSDYARCAGTTHPTCWLCRRSEPSGEQWQNYIAPPIDMITGQCIDFIAPLPVRYSNNTDDGRKYITSEPLLHARTYSHVGTKPTGGGDDE